MNALDVEVVLDVGANDGGYARSLRRLGYGGRIVSFEPTKEASQRLARHAMRDPLWTSMQVAIGDHDGKVQINVAGNMAHSSSLLQMTDRHRHSAPTSAFVSTEIVECVRIETLEADVGIGGKRTFLKMDVQGAEGTVLDGLGGMLKYVIGIQAEMSLAELYSGQTDFRDLLDRIQSYGFTLTGVLGGFTDSETGRMLQFDGVFFRNGLVA